MASDFLLAFRLRKNSALDWGNKDAIQYRGDATGSLQVSYTYDAWGKPLTATGQGFLNMFAYCGNNPVCRVDIAGNFWDTVFDIASLCYGIYDVWQNPDDPMAWVGLVGDVIDIAVPFVSGVGETARLAKCGDKIIDTAGIVHDASKVSDAADSFCDVGNLSGDISQIATKGTPQQIGAIGERLAGIDVKAKQVITVNGRNRIPDALTVSELIEVKNVKYLSNTLQLRDYAQHAKDTDRSLQLCVRPTTKVSQTVINAGWNIRYLWKE